MRPSTPRTCTSASTSAVARAVRCGSASRGEDNLSWVRAIGLGTSPHQQGHVEARVPPVTKKITSVQPASLVTVFKHEKFIRNFESTPRNAPRLPIQTNNHTTSEPHTHVMSNENKFPLKDVFGENGPRKCFSREAWPAGRARGAWPLFAKLLRFGCATASTYVHGTKHNENLTTIPNCHKDPIFFRLFSSNQWSDCTLAP